MSEILATPTAPAAEAAQASAPAAGEEPPEPASPHDAALRPTAQPLPSDDATRVLRRFRVVFNAVKTHFQQVEKKAGLGGAQLWALSLIAAQPGLGVSQLARAMDIHQTTASNLVKVLLTAGLVAVQRNGVDRRTVQLTVLPPGDQVLAVAPGPFTGVLPQALAALDAQTLQRLDHDLGVLIGQLKADERAGSIPLAQM